MNVGSITQDVASPNSKVKRENPPLHMVQNPSRPAISGPANSSGLSLLMADSSEFPTPSPDYSLRFGNSGSHLHPWDLETLLGAVRDEIEEEINAHGRNAHLDSKEYLMRLAGLELWIKIMPWATINLAWAELSIIVEGLWLYFIVGKHDRETFINVINHVKAQQIAFGWIGKPHRP